MKKAKKIKIGLFGSRNKWARRGRNLAHFLMSFMFYVFAYIFYAIAFTSKKTASFVFWAIKKMFSKNKKIESRVKMCVALPDRFSRLNALMKCLEKRPIRDNLSVGTVIDLTDGYSSYDLYKVVKEAEKIAFLRAKQVSQNEPTVICEQDLLDGLRKIKPVAI